MVYPLARKVINPGLDYKILKEKGFHKTTSRVLKIILLAILFVSLINAKLVNKYLTFGGQNWNPLWIRCSSKLYKTTSLVEHVNNRQKRIKF